MRLLAISCMLIAFSCSTEKKQSILADVNGERLYLSDIMTSIPSLDSSQDSMSFINQRAEQWTREQIILAQAKKETESKETEKLVENYRNQLLITRYENKLMSQNLDTIISEEEILAYISDNNIDISKGGAQVKVKFGKFRNNKPDLEKVDALWQNEKWDKIKSYCGTFAEVCVLKDEWISLTELQQYFSKEIFSSDVLEKKGYNQKSGNRYEYFLSIIDYRKKSDGISELDKEKIKKLILHSRSKRFLKEYKEKLYQESLDNQKIKFYFN